MMHRVTVFCAVLCSALVVLPLAGARAQQPPPRGDELDRLSRHLEDRIRELREDVFRPFHEREGFRDVERDLREAQKHAEEIHEMKERGEARPRRVREMLDRIDEEMRHIDRYVDDLARDNSIDRRALERARDDIHDINRILYRIRKEL